MKSIWVFLAQSCSIACILMLSVELAPGQESASGQSHRLRIDSAPKGAYVEFSGQYSFVGRTPFIIPYKLIGSYKIVASKAGYETVSANVNLASKGANQITLRLPRKTPFKAFYRSLLLPGWGQHYGQGLVKGIVVGSVQAVLLTASFRYYQNYNKRQNEYDRAKAAYDKVSSNYVDAQAAYTIVQKKFKEVDNAYSLRNTALMISVGFWVYNMLDAAFLYKTVVNQQGRSVKLTPYFTGGNRNKKLMMSLNVEL